MERERERKYFKSGVKIFQKVWFFGKNECTSNRYGEGETTLATLELERDKRGGETFQGLLCLPLKSGGFLAKMNAPVGGIIIK